MLRFVSDRLRFGAVRFQPFDNRHDLLARIGAGLEGRIMLPWLQRPAKTNRLEAMCYQ
jgi:hypothetical protein